MKKKQTKKVVASENNMEKGATENKSVALISKEEEVNEQPQLKKFKVIKSYDGIEIGSIQVGEFRFEQYMIDNGYWERI